MNDAPPPTAISSRTRTPTPIAPTIPTARQHDPSSADPQLADIPTMEADAHPSPPQGPPAHHRPAETRVVTLGDAARTAWMLSQLAHRKDIDIVGCIQIDAARPTAGGHLLAGAPPAADLNDAHCFAVSLSPDAEHNPNLLAALRQWLQLARRSRIEARWIASADDQFDQRTPPAALRPLLSPILESPPTTKPNTAAPIPAARSRNAQATASPSPTPTPSPSPSATKTTAAPAAPGFRRPDMWLDIDPIDLLDRTPGQLDDAALRRLLAGRRILITGAGGSIGSELARRVLAYKPAAMLLCDRSENALFEIDRQAAMLAPTLSRAALLHDVTDAASTKAMVAAHKPDVILHAAAHKHVPMMEEHPAQAIENNIFGTRSIVDAAVNANVKAFVMISTDKAVRPSSVMGATKRLAELYVQHTQRNTPGAWAIVRFGNVLGSACSVLPIWARQMVEQRAISVTHPEMTRYFMSIPEAAGLVLQAAAIAEDEHNNTPHNTHTPANNIFLLDMGKPVPILELAHRFIAAHGLKPHKDIDINFTGPRPGEKLHEQLAYDSEDLLPTTCPSISRLRTEPPDENALARAFTTFDQLRSGPVGFAWEHADRQSLIAALHDAVPQMQQALRAAS